MEMKPISERLFEEFRRIGVSSYKVSKESGVPQPTFSKYRKDGLQPTRDVLDKICATYPAIDRQYIEFGVHGVVSTNNEPATQESFAAVRDTHAEDIAALLNAQVRHQQEIIDHLIVENKALMRMLQERIGEKMA